MNTNETTLKQVSGMLPDDKARLYGTEALSDAELLAVLLRSGTQGRNVIAMCEEILHTLGGSLAGLFTTPSEQLLRLSGVGKVKQLQLAAVGESLPAWTAVKRCRLLSAAIRIWCCSTS